MHTKYNKNQNINSFSLLTLNFLLKEVIWPGLVFALNQSNLRGLGLTLMGLTRPRELNSILRQSGLL